LLQTLDINFTFCSLFYTIHCINPAFATIIIIIILMAVSLPFY